MTLSDHIKQEAGRLGFHAVGISLVDSHHPPNPAPPQALQEGKPETSFLAHLRKRLREWLERGYQGGMAWLERAPERRSDPRAVLPGCRSVISLGMNYYTDSWADESPGHGRIARYAWGQDYHKVLLDRLKELEKAITRLAPEAGTRRYVDTGPVMEKAWAQQAGLGWIGKHSNLVSPDFGSWLLLGEILTTLDLEPDEPGTDLCGSCRLCIQACPTGAISEPYVVDARRCISYLTIELRHGEDIPDELASKMGNRIFGCDECLDVCPYNNYAQPTSEPAFAPSPLTLAPSLEHMSSMNEGDFAAAFRHSPLRRPKHPGFLRNVRIAQRNTHKPAVSNPSQS